MTRSYRSTYEIINFARKIQNHVINPIERNGAVLQVLISEDKSSEFIIMKSVIKEFLIREYSMLGVICKTNRQVEEIYAHLCKNHAVSKLDASSKTFKSGVIITSVHMAKGLEFDEVIIPRVHRVLQFRV